jgi:hypothetical protein
MKIDFKVSGVPELKRLLDQLALVAPAAARREVDIAALNIETRAKQNLTDEGAVDTGALRTSISSEVTTDSAGIYAVTVGTNQTGPFIEFGTSPHFPPLEPIKEWCSRHGLPESAAFPIARKIAAHGTPERPFMFPAAESERDQFISEVSASIAEAVYGVRP